VPLVKSDAAPEVDASASGGQNSRNPDRLRWGLVVGENKVLDPLCRRSRVFVINAGACMGAWWQGTDITLRRAALYQPVQYDGVPASPAFALVVGSHRP